MMAAEGGGGVTVLRAHTSPVSALAWRPGWHPLAAGAAGVAMASADRSGTVLLWER